MVLSYSWVTIRHNCVPDPQTEAAELNSAIIINFIISICFFLL